MISCLFRSRCAWALLLAVGLGPLAVAYGSQWFLDMHPCHLCLWQRVPYALIAALGVAAFVLRRRAGAVRALVWAAVALLVINGGIAAYHVGIERGWIAGPDGCSGTTPAGMSLEELKAQIESAPAVRCDDAAPFLGSTMPMWNLWLLIALTVGGISYARRLGREAAP